MNESPVVNGIASVCSVSIMMEESIRGIIDEFASD
jgi:hypothetical protein